MIRKIPFTSLIIRTAVLALLWMLLSGNMWHDWPLIVATLIAAAATSCVLSPGTTRRPHLRPIIAFIPFFLKESVAGGIDVARRAYAPRPLLNPAIIDHPLALQSEQARVFFAGVVNLLPGTASVRLGESSLKIHVLDQSLPVRTKLRDLESRVSRMFGDPQEGISPTAPHSGKS